MARGTAQVTIRVEYDTEDLGPSTVNDAEAVQNAITKLIDVGWEQTPWANGVLDLLDVTVEDEGLDVPRYPRHWSP